MVYSSFEPIFFKSSMLLKASQITFALDRLGESMPVGSFSEIDDR